MRRPKVWYYVAMLTIDSRQIKQLESDLKLFKKRAYPFATKATVNSAAFNAQRGARANIKANMITRNAYTRQSIQVDQSRTLNVGRQSATVGSTAEYMEKQEFGGIKRAKGKEGVPLATAYSTGKARGTQPRDRLPRKANKLANIQLNKGKLKRSNRKQRNLVAIKMAAQSGNKYVFLNLGRKKAIFKVTGGKRNPKIQMVHDMTRKSVSIPKSPWLGPAVKQTETRIPALYKDALKFQIKRHKIFR